jgi:2-(1,2-epoxy-1,2-dihydrophenyl)acetyl-CoA isomerase
MTELLHDRVAFSLDNGIARITLAHPQGRNALDLAMATAFRDATQRVTREADAGAVRVVVLAAQGPVFSVGGDLSAVRSAADPSALIGQLAGAMHDGIEALAALSAPVVTAVGGTAAGGGLGLALSGDVVLAGDKAKFVAAYTAAGLTPDCGASWLLGRVGRALALDLLLTNRPMLPAEAHRLGLVSRVVSAGDLVAETEKVVALLAAGPRAAYAAAKALVRNQATDLGTQLQAEAASIAASVSTFDGREGIDAFLNKRPPVFP